MSETTEMQAAAVPAAAFQTDEQLIVAELGKENAATALAICDRLASETASLEQIAGEIRGMDGATAARCFYRWRIRSAALSRLYARACNSRAHVLVQAMMDLIDRETDPHRARVKMDALKWMAGRLNRADFGDEPSAGVSVTINNDSGAAALAVIQDRLRRKRRQLQQLERTQPNAIEATGKSMLLPAGGGFEKAGGGEGEAADRPHAPE